MKTKPVLIGLLSLLVLTLAVASVPDVFAYGTPAGATLTINSDIQMDKLEIVADNTVVMASGQDYTLDLTGAGEAFANSGTFTANTSTVKFSGAVAQSMSGSLTFNKLTHNGAGVLSIGNNLACTGLLTNTQGNFTPAAYGISTSGVVWTAGAITGTPSGVWDIGTSGVDINGGTFVATSGTFTVAGNWDMTGSATFTSGDGTVKFDDTATITSAGKSFKAVTAAADVTLADAFVAGGALIISSEKTFALAGYDCNANSIANSGTFRMNGDETLVTATAIAGGLVKFVDPAGCALSTSISGLPDVEFNSTGKTFTLSEDMTYITGDITVASGTTLAMGGYDMTLAAGGTVTNNGTWSVPTSGSLFTCAGTGTFAGGSMNFYDFTRNPAVGATLTFADGVTYTVEGVLTLKGAGSGTDILNIAKSGTGTNAVLSKDGTSNVEYVAVNGVNGVDGKIITALNSYAAGGSPQNWQFGTGTADAGGVWDATTTWASGQVPGEKDDVTISANVSLVDTSPTVNNLTIAAGKILDCGSQTMTVNGDFSATEGIVTFTGAGTLNLAGTVECSAFGTFNNGQSTVNYSGADQSVDDIDYYSLTLSGSGTKTLCGPIDVDGNLTNLATLDVSNDNNYMITIAGNWFNDGVFYAREGTVTFDGSGDSTLKSGGAEDAFYNMTLNKGDGSKKLSPQTSDLKVSNALTITKGTFNLANSDVRE